MFRHEGVIPVLGPGTLRLNISAFDQCFDALDIVIAGILVSGCACDRVADRFVAAVQDDVHLFFGQ